MKKIIFSLILCVLCAFSMNAQDKGAWYVGTGDIANVAWTNWAVSPTVGYGLTDNMAVGVSITDGDFDFHARYFLNGFFGYVETNGLSTDGIKVGGGKMFTFYKNVFVDPKVVYDTDTEATNLTLGVGLKF